ncbi:transcriptional regulator-like protein [Deinococcus cavernae]|uniref:Transcriptional regulator-like protein n=1 Tax=Deinococcus cavernae TaxID=2320857 RepID=A0A418V9K4_9DEIO|nr:type IV toxin-antitoxin system AbiEi family antitoxin domain-containing protein [Deinococcus cavernae]RJF72737.1 transcriptional regulator-like protein [Deinococcus cavernae]
METSVSQTELLRTRFAQQGSYLTSSQVRAEGIDLKVIGRMIEAGEVEQVQRGVYRHTGADLPEHADLIELQLRVPYARLTLMTALDLHGLTTTRPTRIQVAIPTNRAMPDLTYPPVQVYWYPPEVYEAGTLSFGQPPLTFTTYSPEKTLADLLRMAGKIGRQPYREGLTNYLTRLERNISELLRMARIDRVEDELRRDLEVLTHDETR